VLTQSKEEWTHHLKEALRSWHQMVELGQNPLAGLSIVAERGRSRQYGDDLQGRAKALRDILREAIQALGVPGQSPPEKEGDPAWLAREWRAYNILNLRYLRGLPRVAVQQQIGLAEGGQFYQEQRDALALLVTLLQDWEGYPEGESSLAALAYPSGAVKLSDTFYIVRKADADLQQEMSRPGQTITITGPRQVGKTSLLVRGVQAGVQAYGARVVYLDIQAAAQESLTSGDRFLRDLADWIVDELGLDGRAVEDGWQSSLGAARKLTRLLERVVLADGPPVILALDEVDRLLLTPFHADFFGLLRSWHNLRSRDERWQQLTLLMAISTEPYLLINDLRQSPFNVGLMLYLDDFNDSQVADLNRRYGSRLAAAELPQLLRLLNGHPYLTRVALYTMARDRLRLPDLLAAATAEHGPFISHLRYQGQLVSADPSLRQAMKQVLTRGQCPDDLARHRLLKAGLIKRDGSAVACRCDLYRLYFSEQL
jgi:hypothetical protein